MARLISTDERIAEEIQRETPRDAAWVISQVLQRLAADHSQAVVTGCVRHTFKGVSERDPIPVIEAFDKALVAAIGSVCGPCSEAQVREALAAYYGSTD